jgi:hypothetical protein
MEVKLKLLEKTASLLNDMKKENVTSTQTAILPCILEVEFVRQC